MKINRTTSTMARTQRVPAFVGVPILIALAACNAAAPASSAPGVPSAGQPSGSDEPRASASVAPSLAACLEPDVVAALDEIRGGTFDTEPGREDVADALDTLPLDGAASDARDSLAAALRDADAESSMIVSAAQRLAAEVALPEC